MVKKLLVLTSLLLIGWELRAQLPPPCPSNTFPPSDLCSDICIYCNFNGIQSTSAGYSGQTPPGFCGTIENEQWLGFIAGAGGATFTATPMNCANGNGIQIALYTSCTSSPIGCNGGTSGGGNTPVSITTALTPGVNYFLLIDGFAGDQCDFTITVVPPAAVQAPNVGNTGVLSGPIKACPGATVTYSVPPVTGAGGYIWTAPGDWLINGQSPPVTTTAPGGNVVTVTVGTQSGQVCVQPVNSCNDGTTVCKNVTSAPIPPTVLQPVVICAEDTPYELPWGDVIFASGTYETTLISYQGCDSLVRQQVTVKQPILRFLAPQSICAGACVTICGEQYCDGGSYTHTCESYQGCDSIINFSILVVEPVADIIPNGTLSCSNTSIVLNSAASPGTKVWKNGAGLVIGGGTSLTVTQAGTYILTVTASASGNFCVATDTIVITGNTTPPTVSASGGVLGCGNAQAQLGTNTNATTPQYLWSPAAGLSSTTIANPVATAPGTYTVVVTDQTTGCTNSATVTVSGNTTPPSAAATGGTLTCSLTSLQVTSSTNAANPSFSWSGPNAFTSTVQNPAVMNPGTYTVTITNLTNNCTATATATVALNNTPPSASAAGGIISCLTPSISLTGNSPTGGVSYSWTGPAGFTSALQNPMADTAGVYTLVVANPANGCTSTATATVSGNTLPPNAAANGGLVTCGVQNITITGSSTTPGVTYAWSGPNNFASTQQNPSITAPGVYTVTVTGTNNCTQTATATVNGDFVAPDAAATGGVITCSSTNTSISGTSTTPNAIFAWIGPSGNPYSGPNPTVSNTGVYTLTVTNPVNGCTATATASVVPDANVPNVSAAGGTLNCDTTSITLEGTSTTPGVTLSWVGPNNFVSTQPNPLVTVAGTYTLTVSDPVNGCTAVADAIVVLDDAQPGANAAGGTVTCTAPAIDLTATSGSNNVSWSWTGPGAFVSTTQNPNVLVAGDYFLTVTGANGCTSTAMATVVADQDPPVPASTTGILTCAQTNLTLNGSADVPVTYLWNGPNLFTSDQQNPNVSAPGDYTLTTTANNGCTATTTITVGQDIAPPDIAATGNTISCTTPQVAISGSSNTQGATFTWVGPALNSTSPNPVVSQGGAYTLTVMGPNGCTSQMTVDVLLDTEVPFVIAQSTDVLTCATTTVGIATTATNATSPVQTYAWSNNVSDEDPMVTTPGTYTVTVTSANGCTSTASTTVTQDITLPNVSALGDTLTCIITSVSLDGNSTTPNATYSWVGPGFNSTLPDPMVTAAGDYTLTVMGPNGCTASQTATVVLDGNFPDAVALSTNNLDCNMPSAQLQGSSTTTGVTYTWTDGTGNIIGITPTVSITDPGNYQLAVTAPNGCITNQGVTVTQDITLPGASAAGDTIDCISGQASLTGSSPAASVTWKWTGPNNYSSTQQNPVVSVNGTYTLVVTGSNGCTSSTTAVVEQNTQSPVVDVSGADTLTCLLTSLTLTGNILTPGATGEWLNASGTVLSTQATIDISTPGVYTYKVTAPNGCISAPTATVPQDIVTPQNVVVNGGLINCKNPTLTLTANSSTPGVTYKWSGPNNFNSTQKDPQTGTSGTYTVLLTNPANGCEATAVTFVTEDFVKPVIALATEIITCAKPQVVVNATVTPTNVQYKWAGPGISGNSTVEDPSVSVAGVYNVTVTAVQNGCTEISSIEVKDDVVPPQVSTTGVTLTCTTPSSTISGTSQTPGVTYSWAGPNGFTSTAPSPTVSVPGDYTLTVEAPNGCTSTSIAVVSPDASAPVASAAGGLITCAIPSITLTGGANNPNVTWQWTGPAGFTSTQQNPVVSTPGTYTLTVKATSNGCIDTATAVVPADTQSPNIITGVPKELNCTTTEVSLNASVPDPGTYTYSWTTQGGNILSGASSQSPVVSSAALYSVLVTNQDNGCTATKDVPVIVDSTTVSGAVLAVRDVTCYGKTDGVVGISSVIGGTPTFLYSLDDLPFVTASFFTSLDPGPHKLVIQDANGCEWETSVDIGEPEQLIVNLGPDTTINLGESIQLSIENTVNYPDRVETFVLDPVEIDTAFCNGCELFPKHSFRYFLTVVDSNGCKASDSRTIIVDRTRHVYIPNVFDPGASNNNSLLYIFGGIDVERIKSFRVFDRWGDVVHEYFDFLPNDPDSGWDGTVKGEKANPAVFVYYAEVLFKDGETVLYKGDVALVRNK